MCEMSISHITDTSQPSWSLNPVTALAFYRPSSHRRGSNGHAQPHGHDRPLILAAQGAYVHVYSSSSSSSSSTPNQRPRPLARIRIFASQTVHGIAVRQPSSPRPGAGSAANDSSDASAVLVFWGGSEVLALRGSEVEAFFDLSTTSESTSSRIDEKENEERRGREKEKERSLSSQGITAPDWILHGAVAPSRDSIVLATAHCALLRISWRGNDDGRPELRPVPGGSGVGAAQLPRSICYTARVEYITPETALLIAGTVFGEVEVVRWDLQEDQEEGKGTHLGTFAGHVGSVFGVGVSPEVEVSGRKTRLIATCSDDRTVRIWDLAALGTGQRRSQSPIPEMERLSIRETGFGANYSKTGNVVTDCVAVAMGHASRIWRVEFATWTADSRLQVLSFGEDATWWHWDLEWAGDGSAVETALKHRQTYEYHDGKHIWAAAIIDVDEARKRVITGGGDGKVAIYDLFAPESKVEQLSLLERLVRKRQGKDEQQGPTISSRSWDLDDILEPLRPAQPSPTKEESPDTPTDSTESERATSCSTPKPKKKKKPPKIQKDFPNRYAFAAQDKLLVTTSFGRVLLATLSLSTCSWNELPVPAHHPNDIRGYSVAVGLPKRGVALFAGATGTIYLYSVRTGKIEVVDKIQGKPAAMFDIPDREREGRIFVLVTVLGGETGYILSCHARDYYTNVAQFKLPAGFVVTGARQIRGWLVLGGRHGGLVVYDMRYWLEPVVVKTTGWRRQDDAITDILDINPADCSSDPDAPSAPFHLLITTRASSYSIFSVTVTSTALATATDGLAQAHAHTHTLSFSQVHTSHPRPFGPMIESAWHSSSSTASSAATGDEILLSGFSGANFILWSETHQRTIASIDCGGAHRAYVFSPSGGSGSGSYGGNGGSASAAASHFAYTKASKICVQSQRGASHGVVKEGGHGREIKAVAALAVPEGRDYVATGGEDTLIRIWRRSPFAARGGGGGGRGDGALECAAVAEKHSTGIMHLKWARLGPDAAHQHLFSSGGNEEFHVWAVREVPGFGLGVVCEASLADRSEDRDLRILGFDVVPIREGDDVPGYRISIIYSDSTIKVFHYSPSRPGVPAGRFLRLATARYTSACLTQVVSVSVAVAPADGEDDPSLSPPNLHLLTASTDGHLCLWRLCKQSRQAKRGGQSRSRPASPAGGAPTAGESSSEDEPMSLRLHTRAKIHQSNVSALSVSRPLTIDPRWRLVVVASAGDDNALCLSILRLRGPDVSIHRNVVVPNAHASGISGLEVVSSSSSSSSSSRSSGRGTVQLVSFGGDQRIKRWVVDVGVAEGKEGEGAGEVELKVRRQGEGDDVWTAVADGGGVVVVGDRWKGEGEEQGEGEREGERFCLVVGDGMEVVRVRSEV